MTNLQKLETAIRQALPELMELTEGCEFVIDGTQGVYTLLSLPEWGAEPNKLYFVIKHGKIINPK